jgi:hypothetical protein
LTRAALLHVVEKDEAAAGLVELALALFPRETEKFDPTMLAVGALVLFVFRADINLAHDPGKGWTFKFRTKGLSESTKGKLLGQLMGTVGLRVKGRCAIRWRGPCRTRRTPSAGSCRPW